MHKSQCWHNGLNGWSQWHSNIVPRSGALKRSAFFALLFCYHYMLLALEKNHMKLLNIPVRLIILVNRSWKFSEVLTHR